MRCGVQRPLGLADAIVRRLKRGDRPVERLPALVQELVGGETLLHQRAGAVELLLGERQLGLGEVDVGVRLFEAMLSLLDLGF